MSTKLSNASNEERQGFVQKVYGIVALQVGVTAAMCTLAIYNATFLSVLMNPALTLLSVIGIFVLSIMLCCSKDMRSKVPTNYMLLLLFTVFEGHLVALSCSIYAPHIVGIACLLTAGIFFIMTVYAMTTKYDSTTSLKVLLTLILASISIIIISWFYNPPAIELLSCFIGMIISCFYILYDTQLLMGDRGVKFDLDDYIIAALNIYLDIIKLFIEILRILSKLSNKDKDKDK